jgi:hypothetical protein
MVMFVLLRSGVQEGRVLARGRHRRADSRDLPSRQKRVPVDPLERELPEMVEPGLAEQRQAERGREVARERLGVVVEVDQQGSISFPSSR